MSPTNSVSKNLSKNIKQIREVRGLTQEQLARHSDIPRSTWTNLESGSANPTVSVLVKVAAALQVSVEELIETPRAECQFYAAASLHSKQRGNVLIRRLLPDSLRSMELDRMEFAPDARMAGVPHRSGTREYLTCESGAVRLVLAESQWDLKPGDVVVFRGDQKHAYENRAAKISVAYSVVLVGTAAS
jgi:XRE family transcriptional regulator, regulator of sulfur utilization